jgi:hypothetical protein
MAELVAGGKNIALARYSKPAVAAPFTSLIANIAKD